MRRHWPEHGENAIGLTEVMSRALDTMQAQIARVQLALDPPEVVVRIPRDACLFYEFWRAKEVIEIGRIEAEKALDAAGIELFFPLPSGVNGDFEQRSCRARERLPAYKPQAGVWWRVAPGERNSCHGPSCPFGHPPHEGRKKQVAIREKPGPQPVGHPDIPFGTEHRHARPAPRTHPAHRRHPRRAHRAAAAAARGSSDWFGFLPLWLLGMPLAAWWSVSGFPPCRGSRPRFLVVAARRRDA